MRRGDTVVHVDQPMTHGIGCIVDILRDGLLTVQWPDTDVQDYYPHEIEDADTWERRIVDRLIAETT